MGADRRRDVIDTVHALLDADPRVDGLVLIGSGAVGFRDELSDVDLIAAVAPGLDAAEVGDELARRLAESLPLYRYAQTPPARARGIHVFLLTGHLELDLSFIATSELRALDERWRIVFDRTGDVTRRMSLPRPAGPDRREQARFRFLGGCGSLWFGLKALRRGDLLLAIDRLGQVRQHATALACLEHFGSDDAAAARADELPADDRTDLERLACGATERELERAFASAVAILSHRDETLLQGALGDSEYAGLARWVHEKFARDDT